MGQQKQNWKKPKIYAPHLDVSIEMEEFSRHVTMLIQSLNECVWVKLLGHTIETFVKLRVSQKCESFMDLRDEKAFKLFFSLQTSISEDMKYKESDNRADRAVEGDCE